MMERLFTGCVGDGKRPWAIARWCLLASLVLAVFAELEFLASAAMAHWWRGATLLVWLLPILWPPYYAFVVWIAYGIAVVDQRGPISEQMASWLRPRFASRRFPSHLHFLLIDVFYARISNIVLLLFPIFAALLGLLVLILVGDRTVALEP